ncbi:MAG: transglutaminase domain-containing protein [Prevotellaceae bacterium]|nr:transglutaminase domain-containing protein [Prevotellaceae bacterium]
MVNNDSSLSIEEYGALRFLYAYMPEGDAKGYDRDFFLQNVRASFIARREMPWSKTVPDELFRHFILPVRVNNEALDLSRPIFYEALKPRVRRLSMREAALEVNHWCHEKVTYAPSDSRTSAPLATLRSAIGRCGEESTFAVAAMRAVGIPARQVYTPRWAHTDDNHAWIEVWVDGDWHYMGACEPEPTLDRGWFDAPVKRAMLVHTKVFGRYKSNDEVIAQTPCYTEVNVTGRYAPVKRAVVTVRDAVGNMVAGATVDFEVYNYAEFFPVAAKTTNNTGVATLTVGMGDMLVWARKGDRFGFSLFPAADEQATVTLTMREGDEAAFDFTIIPPVEQPATVDVSDAQRKANDARRQKEDDIRRQYESTFYTKAQADRLAAKLALDSGVVWRYMQASRGNHAEIERFLCRILPGEQPQWALKLLGTISPKDLRDVSADVLQHHLEYALRYTKRYADTTLFVRYVMNPRVADEPLSMYRDLLDYNIDSLVSSPHVLRTAMAGFYTNFHRDDTYNPQSLPVSIRTTAQERKGDMYSLTIAAVGFLRSLGIAARIEPATHRGQYFQDGRWLYFSLDNTDPYAAALAILTDNISPPQGKLALVFTPDEGLKTPRYETHYTLSKYTGGRFAVLGTDERGTILGETTLVNKTVAVDAGYYLLTTGRRMADGSVVGRLAFFSVQAGKTTRLPLTIPGHNERLQVLGNIDVEAQYMSPDGSKTSILQTTGRGYFILALLDAQAEPTVHALHDVAAVADDLEKWGRPLLFLFADDVQLATFDAGEYKRLPSTVAMGYDVGGAILSMLKTALELPTDARPVFIVADSFGRVVYVSQGYSIGLGEMVLTLNVKQDERMKKDE